VTGGFSLDWTRTLLWAYFYRRADDIESQLAQALRTLVDRLGVTELAALIARCQPDAIVCTHFRPVDLLAQERRHGQPIPPLYCVVTDYTGHIFWAYPEVDRYYVATAMTKRLLAQRGVSPKRISVTDIPVDPAIAEPRDRVAVRESLKLGARPVVSFFGSGLTVKRVQQVVTDLRSPGWTRSAMAWMPSAGSSCRRWECHRRRWTSWESASSVRP
jgi:processive 1,2-diacylglycerol beta-glucosyltransferase